MKNLMKLSVVLVAAALAFSSCNCFKKMAKNRDDIKLTVTPEILTLNNGTVAADINVTFPVEYFNKKAIIKVTPVIVFEGGEVAGATQYYQGSKVDENYAVVDKGNGGNYTQEPAAGLRTATSIGLIAGSNSYALQAQYPTRAAAEAYKDTAFARSYGRNDANDVIYQFDASRTYNPWADLEKIDVPLLWVNSADDFINPPGYGIAEQAAARMPRARYVLIPASPETKGHGTHSWAKFWKDDLAKLMAE